MADRTNYGLMVYRDMEDYAAYDDFLPEAYARQEADALLARKDKEIAELNAKERRLMAGLWLILADLHRAKATEIYGRTAILGTWNDAEARKQFNRKQHCERVCREMAEKFK